jgi:hypothetical protein
MPNSPTRRNNVFQRGRSPSGPKSNSPTRRNNVFQRGRPPPRRNNRVMVMYNGHIMTYNNMQKAKEVKRLERAGYSNATARKIVNRYGLANRPSNRMGGMSN